jgi:hypothetical protein
MPNDKGLMSAKLRNDMGGMAVMADVQAENSRLKKSSPAKAKATSNTPPPKYAGMAGSNVPKSKPKMKAKRKMREDTQKNMTRVGKKGSEITNKQKEAMIASRRRLK